MQDIQQRLTKHRLPERSANISPGEAAGLEQQILPAFLAESSERHIHIHPSHPATVAVL